MSEEMKVTLGRWAELALPLLIALAAAVTLMLLLGEAHILDSAISCGTTKKGKGIPCGAGGLVTFINAANSLKGPATAAVGSLAGIGLLAGGALFGISHPSGPKMMMASGATGLVVLLGNGVIQ
jgi:hypothetical protein